MGSVMQLNKMIILRLSIILAAFVICPSLTSYIYTFTKTPSLIEALNANYDNLLDGIPCGSDDLMTCGHYCVHNNYKCDNITDCTDGRDEVPCCQEGYYSCLDGNCVEVAHTCDGNFDCENGLDEFGCSNNLKDNRGCSLLPCMVEVEGGEEGVTTCERDATCHATRSGHGNFLPQIMATSHGSFLPQLTTANGNFLPQLADLLEQMGLGFKNDMKDDKEGMEGMEESMLKGGAGIVNGGWGMWGSWSACNEGSKERTRSCNNPEPSDGGSECPESDTETGACVNGGWGDWGSWSACIEGSRERTRSCNNPEPSDGGSECPESDTDTGACFSV